MKKTTKIWLVAATVLVLTGCSVFGGVMTVLEWDFTNLSTVKYETNNYIIVEDYRNISILSDTADVEFVPSYNNESTVICHEEKNAGHSVEVKDGTLEIKFTDTRKWYEHIGIAFGTTKIKVSIPCGEYGNLLTKSSTGDIVIPKGFVFESIDVAQNTGDVINNSSAAGAVKIKTTTGNIFVENISAQELDLAVSTGHIAACDIACDGNVIIDVSTGNTMLSNIKCKNLTSGGSTGDMVLNGVIVSQKMSIKRSTGDVKFEGCDASEILVKTDTGDVTGTLLSEKVFITGTDTGSIDVPKTTAGGKCEINTDTGDVKLQIK